jgi:hypothetical protein
VGLESHLLGGDLGIGIGHVGVAHREALIHAVGKIKAEDRHRREVQKAPRAAALGSSDGVYRPHDVCTPDLLRALQAE